MISGKPVNELTQLIVIATVLPGLTFPLIAAPVIVGPSIVTGKHWDIVTGKQRKIGRAHV